MYSLYDIEYSPAGCRKIPCCAGSSSPDGLRIVGGHYNLDTGVVQIIA
jgi:hypothetical protein